MCRKIVFCRLNPPPPQPRYRGLVPTPPPLSPQRPFPPEHIYLKMIGATDIVTPPSLPHLLSFFDRYLAGWSQCNQSGQALWGVDDAFLVHKARRARMHRLHLSCQSLTAAQRWKALGPTCPEHMCHCPARPCKGVVQTGHPPCTFFFPPWTFNCARMGWGVHISPSKLGLGPRWGPNYRDHYSVMVQYGSQCAGTNFGVQDFFLTERVFLNVRSPMFCCQGGNAWCSGGYVWCVENKCFISWIISSIPHTTLSIPLHHIKNICHHNKRSSSSHPSLRSFAPKDSSPSHQASVLIT